MGAAVGMNLGLGKRTHSIVIVGDGCAGFSLQALWNAAHENVPVIFAVVDNSAYGILETMTNIFTTASERRQEAYAISGPALDFVRLSEGFGVPAVAVDDLPSLREAAQAALCREGPSLIHVRIGHYFGEAK